MALVDVWPLFGLRLVTPRVELRLVTDDELPALVDQARTIADDVRFFSSDWASRPEPELTDGTVQWNWKARANWSADAWTLNFGVFVDGEPVGIQDITAVRFHRLGVASTGSWLGREHRGGGIGTDARSAVIHFAFTALAARELHSGARRSNGASRGVSEKVGYEANGSTLALMGNGEVDDMMRYRMDRRRWRERRRSDIEVIGFEPCERYFGDLSVLRAEAAADG